MGLENSPARLHLPHCSIDCLGAACRAVAGCARPACSLCTPAAPAPVHSVSLTPSALFRTQVGITPLLCAVASNRVEIVKALLAAGAKTNGTASDDVTPLWLACENNYKDIIGALIDGKADVNKPEVDGWTPLHIAAGMGHTEAVRMLLAAGANPYATLPSKHAPFHVAQGDECVRVLRDASPKILVAQVLAKIPTRAPTPSQRVNVRRLRPAAEPRQALFALCFCRTAWGQAQLPDPTVKPLSVCLCGSGTSSLEQPSVLCLVLRGKSLCGPCHALLWS